MKLGERGPSFQIKDDIDMSVYLSDTGNTDIKDHRAPGLRGLLELELELLESQLNESPVPLMQANTTVQHLRSYYVILCYSIV